MKTSLFTIMKALHFSTRIAKPNLRDFIGIPNGYQCYQDAEKEWARKENYATTIYGGCGSTVWGRTFTITDLQNGLFKTHYHWYEYDCDGNQVVDFTEDVILNMEDTLDYYFERR